MSSFKVFLYNTSSGKYDILMTEGVNSETLEVTFPKNDTTQDRSYKIKYTDDYDCYIEKIITVPAGTNCQTKYCTCDDIQDLRKEEINQVTLSSAKNKNYVLKLSGKDCTLSYDVAFFDNSLANEVTMPSWLKKPVLTTTGITFETAEENETNVERYVYAKILVNGEVCDYVIKITQAAKECIFKVQFNNNWAEDVIIYVVSEDKLNPDGTMKSYDYKYNLGSSHTEIKDYKLNSGENRDNLRLVCVAPGWKVTIKNDPVYVHCNDSTIYSITLEKTVSLVGMYTRNDDTKTTTLGEFRLKDTEPYTGSYSIDSSDVIEHYIKSDDFESKFVFHLKWYVYMGCRCYEPFSTYTDEPVTNLGPIYCSFDIGKSVGTFKNGDNVNLNGRFICYNPSGEGHVSYNYETCSGGQETDTRIGLGTAYTTVSQWRRDITLNGLTVVLITLCPF